MRKLFIAFICALFASPAWALTADTLESFKGKTLADVVHTLGMPEDVTGNGDDTRVYRWASKKDGLPEDKTPFTPPVFEVLPAYLNPEKPMPVVRRKTPCHWAFVARFDKEKMGDWWARWNITEVVKPYSPCNTGRFSAGLIEN